MKRKNNNKKGFTIVELVIVIAVIAILAAVLIPTFSNIIRKAHISSDTQLIRNLNTALVTDKVSNGDHNTMFDALEATKASGYDVGKINASATDNEILWDSKNDVFCYFNKDNGIEYIPETTRTVSDLKDEDYWVISKTVNGKYSTYLYGTTETSIENLTTGLDVGNETTITSISYVNETSNSKSVVIRTNGGTLTIDAPTDTVKHYGAVESLNIIAVANASYHEHGQVKFVEISTGRIALEAGAEVSHIHINAKEDTQEGENAFDEVIISYDRSVDLIEVGFSRDDVEIDEVKGTLVVALQSGTEEITTTTELDYVWLTKQGIYEQIVVSDNADTKENKNETEVEWVDTSDKSVETKDAAQKIANNIGATATVNETQYNVGVNEDRDIILTTTNIETGQEEVAYTLETQANGLTILKDGQNEAVESSVATVANVIAEAVETQPDKTTVETGATLFAGGTGTVSDPFLIVDYDTFQHVSDLYEEGYYYFKVKDGIASISLQDNKDVRLNGSFNGNGVKFTNVNAGIFGVVGSKTATSKEVLLENFNVDFVGGEGVVYSCGTPDLTFKNIDVTGYMLTGWNAGLFLRYGTANVSKDGFDYTVSFDDCSSRAEVYSSTNTFSAILIGHGYEGANNTITINLDSDTDNNINNTVLYYTGNGIAYGNKYYCMTSDTVVVNIDGVEQYRGGYSGFTANKMTGSNVVAIVNGKNPTKTSEGTYQLTPESDTSKVVVSINWQYTEWEKDYTEIIANLAGVGGTFSDKIVFEVNGNDPIKLLDKITAVEIRLGQEEWGYEIVNGKIILNMTNTNSYIDGHVTLIVEQFTGASNIAKYRGSFELATKDKGNDWIIK